MPRSYEHARQTLEDARDRARSMGTSLFERRATEAIDAFPPAAEE